MWTTKGLIVAVAVVAAAVAVSGEMVCEVTQLLGARFNDEGKTKKEVPAATYDQCSSICCADACKGFTFSKVTGTGVCTLYSEVLVDIPDPDYNSGTATVPLGERGESQHVGCYKDTYPTGLTFRADLTAEQVTMESCVEACAAEYYYAGLQFGYTCWCGSYFDATLPAEGKCDIPCTSDPSQTCGGRLALDISTTGYSIDKCDTLLPTITSAKAVATPGGGVVLRVVYNVAKFSRLCYCNSWEILAVNAEDKTKTYPLTVPCSYTEQTGPITVDVPVGELPQGKYRILAKMLGARVGDETYRALPPVDFCQAEAPSALAKPTMFPAPTKPMPRYTPLTVRWTEASSWGSACGLGLVKSYSVFFKTATKTLEFRANSAARSLVVYNLTEGVYQWFVAANNGYSYGVSPSQNVTLTQPVCGDGIVSEKEECEKGAKGCTAQCKCDKTQGYHVASPPQYNCTTVCGDDIVAGNEQCEKGGIGCTDCRCTKQCMVPTSPKATKNCAPKEGSQCSRNSSSTFMWCNADGSTNKVSCPVDKFCLLAEGTFGKQQPCTPAVCGDGIAVGSEECDGGSHCINAVCKCELGWFKTKPLSSGCSNRPPPEDAVPKDSKSNTGAIVGGIVGGVGGLVIVVAVLAAIIFLVFRSQESKKKELEAMEAQSTMAQSSAASNQIIDGRSCAFVPAVSGAPGSTTNSVTSTGGMPSVVIGTGAELGGGQMAGGPMDMSAFPSINLAVPPPESVPPPS